MPRIARLLVKGEPGVYHVISRTALNGFVMGDMEKDFLLQHIKRLSAVYFVEILGFCCMNTHFHLLCRMMPEEEFCDDEVRKRFQFYYGNDPKNDLHRDQIPHFRTRWENLSEFVREIKQGFSRFYNKRHKRKGFFWAERFKSLLVEDGDTLINCLAYIDLNPVRAGIVTKPEEYRWCSLGYHVQTNNKDRFLSLEFGLQEHVHLSAVERFGRYRAYVYEKGGIIRDPESSEILVLPLAEKDRFRYRSRYFVDSGIIGSKEFVRRVYSQFKELFASKHEKKPRSISGIPGMYSLKRLSENL